MSPRERNIETLSRRIKRLYREELSAKSKPKRMGLFLLRWLLMLYWKFLKDDVQMRAQALSYLMVFSFLPLFAGAGFIVSFFARFGFVEQAVTSFMDQFLSTFPTDQAIALQDFALDFKEKYFDRITHTSSSLGIFAVLFLLWVGLQTYSNIDHLLNFIWSSERARPALERLRNVIVVAFVAPIVVIGSLSMPLILMKIPTTHDLFTNFPLLRSLVNFFFPLALTVGTFAAVYRYGPTRKVSWRASITAGSLAALALIFANWAVSLYFHFGTQSLYGKAAIVPLFCFWIYIVWIVVIMGAELSYLIQNRKFLTLAGEQSPTFFETECLLAILLYSLDAHRHGRTPVTFDQLFEFTYLDRSELRRLLNYAEKKRMLILVAGERQSEDFEFALAQDIGAMQISTILRDYMIETLPRLKNNSISTAFHEAVESFVKHFEGKTLKEYASVRPN